MSELTKTERRRADEQDIIKAARGLWEAVRCEDEDTPEAEDALELLLETIDAVTLGLPAPTLR